MKFTLRHLTRTLAEGDVLSALIECGRDFLVREVNRDTGKGPGNFVVTIWASDVLIGVIGDDADGLTIHRLAGWKRFVTEKISDI